MGKHIREYDVNLRLNVCEFLSQTIYLLILYGWCKHFNLFCIYDIFAIIDIYFLFMKMTCYYSYNKLICLL